MTAPTPTPTHGDNGGPKVNAEFEAISARISDLYDEAKNWADGEPIASAEVAEAVTALFDGLHAAGNEAEVLRKAEVRPLDDAKTEVQARFHPLIGDTKAGRGKVVLGKAALQSLLTAWRAAEQKRAQEAADKARREADALRAEAEEAIRSSAGNLEAREAAEEVLSFAKEADRFARRTEKAATTGTGLRATWVAELKDEGLALDWAYGTTQNKWDSVLPLDRLWAEYRRVCRGAIVLTASQPFASALVMSNLPMFKYEWVWVKSKITGVLNAKKMPVRKHELVLVFASAPTVYNAQGLIAKGTITKQGGSSDNYGERSSDAYVQEWTNWPRDVLDVASEGATVHPTQKPVALMEYLIRTYTNEGDTVLDNTMGSGTTGVAAATTGRKFIGMEMDAGYFEIACGRIAGAALPVAANDNLPPAQAGGQAALF